MPTNENKPVVSLQAYVRSGAVQERLEALVGDRAGTFTTSLMSTVNSNALLQECPPETVVKAAIVAAGMMLPIDPGLGLAFIVPYWNEKKGIREAQFQIGWKGLVRLAIRSAEYRTINVTDVREGEYIGLDRLSGRHEFKFVADETERNKLPIVGYVSFFELLNGFTKTWFMTSVELEDHAKTYSQNYKKYGTGLWKTDKPSMCRKTTLKLLISGYGPMSTDLQKALRADQAAIKDDDSFDYIDNAKRAAAERDGVIDQTPAAEGEPEADQTPPAPTEAEADQTPPADAEPK